MDEELLGIDKNERGPVQRRPDDFGDIIGLCFGAWGEASEDVHKLVQIISESRLRYQGFQRGRPGSEHELGVIVGQVRRRLSMAVMKSQVDCLLSKIHQVGPGNKQLAQKSDFAAKEDNRMSLEHQAQFVRRIEGLRTLRRGFIRTAG